ncbi:MAG: hypothetical protein Q7T30_00115, partial [Planctomycetota bacterium]|nr:hypothetical protein [Planctomycetota bacterium]
MNVVRRLGCCLLTLLPAATAMAQGATFAGATLAQWLHPGLPPSGVAVPPELTAEVTRQRALRAFGIEREPIAFLHRVVGDPGDPATLGLVLEAIPELPARDQFAGDLLARWRLHRDHPGTLRALLAVDPMAWPGIEGELRAEL